MKTVHFYTREGCHLCEKALVIVERVRAREPFELVMVDIDGDPALKEKYGWDIPVVEVDGRRHAKYHLDEDAFLKRLQSP